MEKTYKTTWCEIIEEGGKHRSHPDVNILDKSEIYTILATMEFFGATLQDIRQVYYDLAGPRYKVYDWLGMCIQGRMENQTALKVLIHAFRTAGYDEKKFINNLRRNDYQILTEWESVEIN